MDSNAKIDVMVNVIVGLNVKNILSSINIGIAKIIEPIIYLPMDTGKSAETLPVCPLTVAYATRSLFRYDKNHTGNIAVSTCSHCACNLSVKLLFVSK